MKRSSKRLLMFLIVTSLLVTTLAGCTGSKRGGGTEPAVAKKPIKGGSIIIGCDQEPVILNPFLPDGTSIATKMVISNVLWGLLVVTPSLEYAPRVAESVPTLENGLVTENPFAVTYKIKEQAVWSDGTPITSHDVKFTWETIMDPKRRVADRSGYDKIEHIYTPDDKTVKLVFREPYAAYKDLFSTVYCILPKHILEGKSYDEMLNDILMFASGPYKFKEWEHGDHLTIVKNERFWEEGPYIEKVTFKFMPKVSEQLSKFTNDEVDVIYPTSNRMVLDHLKGLKDKKVEDDPGLIWEHIALNLSRPPLDDINIRKAIAHAIDKERIALEATGRGQVLDSIVMPTQKHYYTPAWKRYSFSIEKAKGYLAKAGYRKGAGGIYEKDGKHLVLTISTTSGDLSREKAEKIMKGDFEAAGMKLEIRNTDRSSLFNSWIPKGNFQIAIWAWLASPEPQLNYLFASDKIPSSGLNYYRYRDDEVTKMLNSLPGVLHVGERALTYRKIQEKISDNVVVIPLYRRPQVLAYDKKINGVKNNVSFEGPFWNLEDWWISGK
ncbi:MAG: peptide ABC transporter substrate-binding protein [Actinobacteria bacterium]|nr:peptide ABC transporter substrate-binding protein [Actinomycetota bacterium]